MFLFIINHEELLGQIHDYGKNGVDFATMHIASINQK